MRNVFLVRVHAPFHQRTFSVRHVLLVGYGAMGAYVHGQLQAMRPELVWTVLTRARPRVPVPSVSGEAPRLLTSLADYSGTLPDLVLECAGHEAVATVLPALLRQGVPAVVTSVGALANPHTVQALDDACAQAGTQVTLVSGALGGLDALGAAAIAPLQEVLYQGRKPPTGWKGTAAEACCDLTALQTATVFFEGSAREAAQRFPHNANVAAAVGLAGIGMDATRVQLVADPGLTRNTHRVSAQGAFGTIDITIAAQPFEANPKTSALAGMSVVNTVLRRLRPITF